MRYSTTLVGGLGLIGVALVLVACGGQVEETPAPDVGMGLEAVIAATGELLPEERSTLSVQREGLVVEVGVETGDRVAVGEILVRLDGSQARLGVEEAQAALDRAEARLAVERASPRPGDIAAAEAQLAAAEAALVQAIARRDRLISGDLQAQVAAAEAELAAAEQGRKEAVIDYDGLQEREDVDPWQQDVAAARLHAAEERVEAAEMRLTYVRQRVAARRREAGGAVQAAQAERDRAQAQLDLLKVQPTAEQIALTESEVERVRVALEAARLAVERCELRAPFAGVVGEVLVREGERVTAGQPLVTMGDVATLRVETTDLSEVDVARVESGQPVTVTFDALPEQTFVGHVGRIDPMAQPGQGGVNYRTIVVLSEVHPRLRWGMTAFVDISVDEEGTKDTP